MRTPRPPAGQAHATDVQLHAFTGMVTYNLLFSSVENVVLFKFAYKLINFVQ